jgi:hypothetical protein
MRNASCVEDRIACISAATSPDILDNVAKVIWADWGKGLLTDDEASSLTAAVDQRRPVTLYRPSPNGAGSARQVGNLVGRIGRRLGSRYTPRAARKRLTDEERTNRRCRRRMLGGSSAMPDNLRHYYTEGERAVMCVVAGEVKRHGICDLPIDEVADRAGVGRTTVQNALHEARRLGHVEITERPRRGAKSLPNIVAIASAEWRTWIKRGPPAAHGIGFKTKSVNATKNIALRKKEAFDEVDTRRPLRTPNDTTRMRTNL